MAEGGGEGDCKLVGTGPLPVGGGVKPLDEEVEPVGEGGAPVGEPFGGGGKRRVVEVEPVPDPSEDESLEEGGAPVGGGKRRVVEVEPVPDTGKDESIEVEPFREGGGLGGWSRGSIDVESTLEDTLCKLSPAEILLIVNSALAPVSSEPEPNAGERGFREILFKPRRDFSLVMILGEKVVSLIGVRASLITLCNKGYSS